MKKINFLAIYFILTLAIGISFADSIFTVFSTSVIMIPILFVINILQQKHIEQNTITFKKLSLSMLGLFVFLLPFGIYGFGIYPPDLYIPLICMALMAPLFFLVPKESEQRKPIQRIVLFSSATMLCCFLIKVISTNHIQSVAFLDIPLVVASVVFQIITLMLLSGYFNSLIFGSKPRTFSNLFYDHYGKIKND